MVIGSSLRKRVGTNVAANAMGQPRYDRLRLVVGEGDSASSSSIKDTLGTRGIRRVVTCNGTDNLYDALDTEIVDLLLYDYDMLGPDFVEVMQRIRRKARGKNPFVIIVATVQDFGGRDRAAADQRRRGRSDPQAGLGRSPLRQPGNFSAKRKPFVVSYDYVGPTRRLGRRAEEAPDQLIRVPNTLRSRAIEGVSDIDLQRMVDSAVASLDGKQLNSCGIEIDMLSQRVADAYGSRPTPTKTNRMYAVPSIASKWWLMICAIEQRVRPRSGSPIWPRCWSPSRRGSCAPRPARPPSKSNC